MAISIPIRLRELGQVEKSRRKPQRASDLDQLLFDMMTPVCLVYHLPNSDQESRQDLASAMQAALVQVLVAMPEFSGSIGRESSRNAAIINYEQDPDTPVTPFSVSGIETIESGLPSYEDLEFRAFPSKMISSSAFSPMNETYQAFGGEANVEHPLLGLRLTFIENGLVAYFVINHIFADMNGFEAVIPYWCSCVRNHYKPGPAAAIPDLCFDRSILRGDRFDGHAASWDFIKSGRIGIEDMADTLQTSRPPVMTATYSISETTIGNLKASSTLQDGSALRLTSTSLITALLWRAVTRARLQLERPSDGYTQFYTTVGLRPLTADVIPVNYIGNAFLTIGTERLTIAHLLNNMSILETAALVRTSTSGVKADLVRNVLKFVQHLPSYGSTLTSPMSHFTMDFNMTSWTSMTLYKSADFGFGPPRAIRSPENGVEAAILYPRRHEEPVDDGLELFVSLESGCQSLLAQDPEFMSYFSLRNIGDQTAPTNDGR